MGIHEYEEGRSLMLNGCSFYGLIHAAMRKADSQNLARLKVAFPSTWAELSARYDAPGGLLEGESTK